MIRLLIATRNPGKLRELQRLLEGTAVTLETLATHPEVPEIDETGESFEENARSKAACAARATGLFALGEDSGLEVAALGSAPGVRSARFSGVHGDDRANNERLLRELEGVCDRRARYVCCVVLADPHGRILAAEHGVCHGRIIEAPRGEGGFGYDPLFVPDGEPRTMAELSADEKSALSHRGRALRSLLPTLLAKLDPNPSR
ncbi:MAG: RdgB/HAM1 family non-canonical purine NTP pyrophosphatase [Myxococcota bacterium]